MEASGTTATATTAVVRARLASVLGSSGRIGRWSLVRIDRARRLLELLLVLLLVIVESTTTTEATTTATAATTHTGSAAHATLVDVRLRHIIIHALPRSWGAAATTSHTVALLLTTIVVAATLLVLLLLKHLLLVGVVSRPVLVCSALQICLATLLLILAGHLIHHLLHHGRVHVAASHGIGTTIASTRAAALLCVHHHLLLHLLHLHHLHHGCLRVHTHAACHAAIHRHLLLPHGKHLLHLLHLASHGLGGHTTGSRAHSTATHIGVLLHVVIAHAAFASAELASTSVGFLFLPHVAARLSFLHLDRFAMNRKVSRQACVNACLGLKRHETKASGSSGVFVHHECSVYNASELCEVILELRVGCLLAYTANKNLARLLLFVSWNRSLRVDLGGSPNQLSSARSSLNGGASYNFTVQIMLLDHNNVHRLGILEGEKTETS